MGSVYLGRSRAGRAVTVKVARTELVTEPGFPERFRHETGMARQIGGFWTAAVVDADPEARAPGWPCRTFPAPACTRRCPRRTPWTSLPRCGWLPGLPTGCHP
jgi:eukaryotic-like serine/threonine-protein kinase